MHKKIIPMSAGAFFDVDKDSCLEAYFLDHCRVSNPKICYLGTANGDNHNSIYRFYASCARHACRPSHLSLFELRVSNLEDFILDQDAIFVGGGKTPNLLALWREWGLVEIFRHAYEQGIVLGGRSAGGVCWFDQSVMDVLADSYLLRPCLGFIKGSLCVHYDENSPYKSIYRDNVGRGDCQPGIAMEESTAVLFKDGKFVEAVCSVKDAATYQVTQGENMQFKEERITTRLLDCLKLN
ncbi:MAG: Type 1 glutamine amidotransferase-like domain-containing protein [Planctomycetes bacterium]|nr:Type 1 glutamine amidotransferase-like domain-containing protein [Planctomycetota bacterium]